MTTVVCLITRGAKNSKAMHAASAIADTGFEPSTKHSGFGTPAPGDQVTRLTIIEMTLPHLLYKSECELCGSIYHSCRCSKPPRRQVA